RHGPAVVRAHLHRLLHSGRQRRAVAQGAGDSMSLHLSHDLGVWVSAFLTLCVFSFLYKDNPFYKFAEHLFVGVSAGYYIILNFWTVLVANLWDPLKAAAAGHGVHAARTGVFAVEQRDYRGRLLLPGLMGPLLV